MTGPAPIPEHPADVAMSVGRRLGALADLIASVKDLHCVDPDGLSAMVAQMADELRRLSALLSR